MYNYILQEAFRHVDFDYNYKFAKAAKDAGIRMMSLLSSQGAKATSYFLYLKTKGEVCLSNLLKNATLFVSICFSRLVGEKSERDPVF